MALSSMTLAAAFADKRQLSNVEPKNASPATTIFGEWLRMRAGVGFPSGAVYAVVTWEILGHHDT